MTALNRHRALIEKMRAAGKTMVAIAAAIGVTERALYKAVARWRSEAAASNDPVDGLISDLVDETARRAGAGEPQDLDDDAAERAAAERGERGYDPVLPGFVVKSVTSQIGADGKSKGHSVKQTKAPGDVFAVPKGQAIKGVSVFVDPDGRELFKWIKTTRDGSAVDIVGALREALADTPVAIPEILPPTCVNADHLTVYPIADPHFGMLAWGKETGRPYDLKIAEEILVGSARELIEQSPASEEAVVLGLGDWYHTNDHKNVTPGSGHALDVDSRHDKAFLVGVKAAITIIDLALAKHGRVLVRMIKGNHDTDPAYALSVALAIRYENNPRVTIDLTPALHWCHRFGNVMLVASHGHAVKAGQIAGMAAAYWPRVWGETEHRYAYLGHLHSSAAQRKKDNPGMEAEHFRTVSPGDGWAFGNGYFAGRSLVSITHHRRTGEKFRTTLNLSTDLAAEAA